MTGSLELAVRKRRTLNEAWQAIQCNGRLSKSTETREEIKQFSVDVPTHLDRIQSQLQKRSFVFKPAKGVKAKKKDKTGFRPLVVAPVESRVVQRAVHDTLLQVPAIEALVRTPHSFGGVRKGSEDEWSSVPAAINSVLQAIAEGGTYIIRSDIQKFFTRIPKKEVRSILAGAIQEDGFLDLFDRAVACELSNMDALRNDASAFPIEDIGVAQGNSLSPLLGNLLLREFDSELNSLPHIRCIRFIDDFVLLSPNRSAGFRAFERAQKLLGKWGMNLSTEKTQYTDVNRSFEFLGIEFNNGFLRPSTGARLRFLCSVRELLKGGESALFKYKATNHIERKSAMLRTLLLLSESIVGWGSHYRFCNDGRCLELMDAEISKLLRSYFGAYRSVREEVGLASTWDLLGLQSLEKIERQSFLWPKRPAS